MMTLSEYTAIDPREATPSASSRLFAFYRVRSGTSTRFFPAVGARLHFASRDVDTFECETPAGFFVSGDAVTCHYKGVCVFRGSVDSISSRASRGDDAVQSVVFSGPWGKMARLVARQSWHDLDSLALSSRLILNVDYLGVQQTVNAALTEQLDRYATACGFTRGTVSVSTQILPSDECRDLTLADVVKRLLRFFPNAVCRFDYSTATPTLNVVRPSASASVAYAATIPKTERETTLDAHPITGVDLEIETTGTVDGASYRHLTHQTAGNVSADNPDCLYATLQLRGFSSDSTKQTFESVTEAIPANLNDAEWWKARHPRLATVAQSAIAITEATRTPSNYPRISAASAGEIEAAGLHCEVSKFTCKAKITTTDDIEEEIFLTLEYLTTNATGTAASPKKYEWTVAQSATTGETVPANLAATLLAERMGSLKQVRMRVRLADALPALGDALVESEGTVFLQQIDVDCADLAADLVFGVPDHLPPEDLAGVLSGFRNKCTTTMSSVRETGQGGRDGDEVEMGAIPPLSSSEFAPGRKILMKLYDSADDTSGTIVLNAHLMASYQTMTVHTLTVDGTATAKILSTEDVTITTGSGSGGGGSGGSSGVDAIVAGSGIELSPSSGTGTVTISAVYV